MASEQSFVDFICEQTDLGASLSSKKMFGEYALYLDGKVVALICDNLLFIKPTTQGKALLGKVNEQPPYPGAKPSFQLGDEIDDKALLKHLFITTAQALPPPKPKVVKQKK